MKRTSFSIMVERFLICFIIAVVIFSVFQISFLLCGVVCLGCTGVLRIKYRENCKSLCMTLSVLLPAVLAGFFAAAFLSTGKEFAFTRDEEIIMLLALLIVWAALLATALGKNGKKDLPKKELMETQTYDLKRIISYLDDFDIIGIDGIWGSGKTFLLDHFAEQPTITNRYIFVRIDLLSCNIEQIHRVIFDAIERVLNSYGIYSEKSGQIKRLLSDTGIFQNLYAFLRQEDISYSEALNGIKKELTYLIDKTLVVVYEDIDRITDIETVKRIFSISEQLVCDKIKIVYQYDNQNLEDMGFDRRYLEKYIPYVVRLTPSSFFLVIQHLYEVELQTKTYFDIKDFDFLKIPQYLIFGKIRRAISVTLDGAGIRKVKHFLYELCNAYADKPEFRQKENRQTVVSFFIIKHFFTDLYAKLSVAESLPEMSLLMLGDQKLSVHECVRLLKKKSEHAEKHLETILQHTPSREVLYWAEALGYDISLELPERSEDISDIYNENQHLTKRMDHNEKIDRLIWNLMCNGKSEYTDYATAVQKFIREVLNEKPNRRKHAYESYCNDLFVGNLYKKDNGTIMRVGVDPFFSLFKAFFVYENRDDVWKKLLDFTFDEYAKKATDTVFGLLRYCKISSHKGFLHALKCFNRLEIVGNHNEFAYYKDFLTRYLSAMSGFCGVGGEELYMIAAGTPISAQKDTVLYALGQISSRLEKLQSEIPLACVKNDIGVYLAFVEKNRQIIQTDAAYVHPPFFQTSMRDYYKNQETYNRLKKIRNRKQLLAELQKLYQAGKISVQEVKMLLDKNT